MELLQKITVAADVADVWPYLADPVRHADWNSKLISIGRDAAGPVRVGERYEILTRIGSKEKRIPIEVTAVEPFTRLSFRHGDERVRRGSFDESFELTPTSTGVRVVRTIDLSRAVSWPLRVLIWLIGRVGREADVPQLERLRRLVEAGRADA